MTARVLVAAGLLAGTATGADVLAVTRIGDTVKLRLDDGFAEVHWLGPSAVRVRQAWGDQPISRDGRAIEKTDFQLSDQERAVTLRSRDLAVHISKRPIQVRFEEIGQESLTEQKSPPSRDPKGILHRFLLGPDERLFGLGPAADFLHLRGANIVTRTPLLISSQGYGLYFPGSHEVVFDLGKSDPADLGVRVPGALRADFVFYVGTPAHILEQHFDAYGDPIQPDQTHAGILSPERKPSYAHTVSGTWLEAIRQTLQAGLSSIPVTAIDTSRISGFQSGLSGDLLSAVWPIVLVSERHPLSSPAIALRRAFESHRLTYLMEVRDRGLPPLHSMAHQFPNDSDAVDLDDQFFFGDELLVAPFLQSEGQRSVYLPQGIWTNWHTNEVTYGKQTIQVSPKSGRLPIWARNGSIVPADREDLLELHYFPKLGGEYFLWEVEIDEITQIHAGPAVDILRLQIEEKAGRAYEWVVHNVADPVSVSLAGELFFESRTDDPLSHAQWRYDNEQRNLHIRLNAKSGDDLILEIAFQSNPWFLQ